ncbi:MAG TPA: peptidoglycan DD-metalloendopeptidase family protein [Gaiellaceae bacterium]
MVRRLPPLLVLALVLAAPALGTGPADRKQQVDQRLSNLHERIAEARAREQVLSSEIDSVTNDIRSLDRQVGDVSARLAPLEQDLALHQRQLDKLNELFRLQTDRLHFLRREYEVAVTRLELRVVAIYESDSIETLDVVFSSASYGDMLEQFDFSDRIRAQDAGIAQAVGRARDETEAVRARTRSTRARVAVVTKTIEVRTEQVRVLRDSLLSRENALSSARAQKHQAVSQAHASLKQMLDDAEALQQVSADLQAKIQAAQGTSSPTPSGSGLIWPVNGSVASPFGWRCLEGICRMHEGIDIAVGYGTPIQAAAAGTVIYTGWEGGYGNLIVIDHGGGLATAYAHQERFAVGNGAHVAQGQVIGYVGCTGHCYGPHLHFEVRVNGSAVDPLGYL